MRDDDSDAKAPAPGAPAKAEPAANGPGKDAAEKDKTNARRLASARAKKGSKAAKRPRKGSGRRKDKGKGNGADRGEGVEAAVATPAPPSGDGADASPAPAAEGALARFPDSPRERKILDQRAAQLARVDDSEQDTGEREPFIQFRLGAKERYGIPHRHAEAIMSRSEMAPVPCTPPFVAGVVNRRGRLLTILDLKKFFDTGTDGYGDEAEVIVIGSNGISVGVLADAVETDGTYDPAALAPKLASGGVSNLDYVKGIYAGRIAILDVEAILADPALTVNDKVE